MDRALYGLKLGGQAWHRRLDNELRKSEAKPTARDACIYLFGSGNERITLVIYVDDILMLGGSLEKIDELSSKLTRKFKIKELGELKRFLDIEIDISSKALFIYQKIYVQLMLDQFGIADSHPDSTPILS